MKPTSLYIPILCTLLSAASTHAFNSISSTQAGIFESNCSTNYQSYNCFDEVHANQERQFIDFWRWEQALEEQLNRLLAALYKMPDNEQKQHLFEKAEDLYQQAEVHKQKSQELEPDIIAVNEKFAELKGQIDDLYWFLKQAEDEETAAGLEVKLEKLQQESIKMDMKGVALGYEKLDKLLPIATEKEDFIKLLQVYLNEEPFR